MRIRGTNRPACNLCVYAVSKDGKINCSKSGERKKPKDSCPGFKYDIFKYKPTVQNDFGKFSIEDFEI